MESSNTKSLDDTNPSITQPATRKNVVKAPIYITIGPQGSGKTTCLSNLKQQKHSNDTTTILKDISIDDQYGVYLPTPIELWLRNQPPSRRNSTEETSSLLRTSVHGKTISERIYDDPSKYEMRFVVQRLHDVISSYDFKQCIVSLGGGSGGGQYNNYYQNNMDKQTNLNLRKLVKRESASVSQKVDWKETLINVVEDFHRNKSGFERCTHVQLFIMDSIFKNPTPTLLSLISSLSINDNEEQESITSSTNDNSQHSNKMSGLNAAIKNLTDIAINQLNVPIAWGNTNAKETDYIAALDAAQKSQRPVIFIPYLDERQSRGISRHSQLDNDKMIILPRLDMNELFRRNIQRCYLTGKYVPMKIIIDTCLAVDALIEKAINETKSCSQKKMTATNGGTNFHFSKFELDCTLAKMAGFDMNNDRTVSRIIIEANKGHPRCKSSSSGSSQNYSGHSRRGNGKGKGKGRGRGRQR